MKSYSIHLFLALLLIGLSGCTPPAQEEASAPVQTEVKAPSGKAQNQEVNREDEAKFAKFANKRWVLVLQGGNEVGRLAFRNFQAGDFGALEELGVIVLGDEEFTSTFSDEAVQMESFVRIPSQLKGVRSLPSLFKRTENGDYAVAATGPNLAPSL